MRTGIKRNIAFSVWNERDCARVADAAFRVLERTGCAVHNAKALELLEGAGCLVEGSLARIPYGLTQWAVARAPRSVTLYDRLGAPAMVLSPDLVHFGPTITNTRLVDIDTGEARQATRADSERAALVIDALPNVSWASGFNSISDIDQRAADVAELRSVIPNTTKPIMFWANDAANLELEFEMFAAVAGSPEAFRARPFAINLICPMDPLAHTDNGLAQIMIMAERGCPSVYVPGIAFGLSGPITLAGGVAVGLADTLAGLVVAQLVRPGAPFVVSKFNDNLDMKTASMSHSRPEMVAAQCATSDLFRHLGLPFCSNFGSTDSGVFDHVAVFDKAVHLYSALLSGVNMVFSLGTYEAGNLTRLEDLAFCDEAISFLRRLVEGVEVSDDTLAEDLIHTVGPGGNFMTTKHTIANFKRNWGPDLLKPLNYEKGREAGPGGALEERIRLRTKEIIGRGPQNPLPAEVLAKLDGILDRAVKAAALKG
jgi:trimethylamine--corrinoid protein Co-methyltransferase